MLAISVIGQSTCPEKELNSILNFGIAVDFCLSDLAQQHSLEDCNPDIKEAQLEEFNTLVLCRSERKALLDVTGRILAGWFDPRHNDQVKVRRAAVKVLRNAASTLAFNPDNPQQPNNVLEAATALIVAARKEDDEEVLLGIIAGLDENVTKDTPINIRDLALIELDQLSDRADLTASVRRAASITFQKLKALAEKPSFPEPPPTPVGPRQNVPTTTTTTSTPVVPRSVLPIVLGIGALAIFGTVAVIAWRSTRSTPAPRARSRYAGARRRRVVSGLAAYYDAPADAPPPIAEVAKRWAKAGDKVYDPPKPWVFWYPVDEVLKYREYDWSRQDARLSPEEWDAIKADMREAGWTRSKGAREKYPDNGIDPAHVIVGKNGHVKVGEGNHRLMIAKELGIKRVPVRFHFHQNVTSEEGRTVKVSLDGSRYAGSGSGSRRP